MLKLQAIDQALAACRPAVLPADIDRRDFFGDKVTPEIARLCASCPVQCECLAYGVATRSYGVWGGEILLTESRNKRRRKAYRQRTWFDYAHGTVESFKLGCGCIRCREAIAEVTR